ncbi:MAG: P-II family nitrogen regulator [Treponema sp.]|jgi:nitrogen regulatory protein PII|nr:P-II family nitrogen regulator [Treponema sp.]
MAEKKTGFFKWPGIALGKLIKLPRLRGAESPTPGPKVPPRLKLVIFIIDWNKAHLLSQVFEEEHVRFHFISKGQGTASSEILDLLGLGASAKAVVICLEQEILAPVLLKEVRQKVGRRSPGAGIAFSIPLSGINTPILQVFKESILKNEKIIPSGEDESIARQGQGGEPMKSEINNDLIVSIINQGYSDEFMTAAREAGASGGTVINARGLAHSGPVKFFGVSVQDEKEMVLILSSREKKVSIMQAVSEACGIATKAGGIIFSLPVDQVVGMSFD